MMRPPRPVHEYDGHREYPSARRSWLSRRTFLRGTGAATASAAFAGFTAHAGAAKPKRPKRQRVTIYLDRYTQIGNSGLRAQKVDVFTGNKRLAKFLKQHSDQRRVKQALMKRLRKVKPETLYDGRKLYRLELTLGAIVREQYQKRTKRRIGQPDLMLTITRYYRYRRMGGAMISPRIRRVPIRIKRPKTRP